jgi:hypothetical protein
MIKFAELFPDRAIVAALSQQLGWSHFIELIPLDDPLKREFYAEMLDRCCSPGRKLPGRTRLGGGRRWEGANTPLVRTV